MRLNYFNPALAFYKGCECEITLDKSESENNVHISDVMYNYLENDSQSEDSRRLAYFDGTVGGTDSARKTAQPVQVSKAEELDQGVVTQEATLHIVDDLSENFGVLFSEMITKVKKEKELAGILRGQIPQLKKVADDELVSQLSKLYKANSAKGTKTLKKVIEVVDTYMVAKEGKIVNEFVNQPLLRNCLVNLFRNFDKLSPEEKGKMLIRGREAIKQFCLKHPKAVQRGKTGTTLSVGGAIVYLIGRWSGSSNGSEEPEENVSYDLDSVKNLIDEQDSTGQLREVEEQELSYESLKDGKKLARNVRTQMFVTRFDARKLFYNIKGSKLPRKQWRVQIPKNSGLTPEIFENSNAFGIIRNFLYRNRVDGFSLRPIASNLKDSGGVVFRSPLFNAGTMDILVGYGHVINGGFSFECSKAVPVFQGLYSYIIGVEVLKVKGNKFGAIIGTIDANFELGPMSLIIEEEM